MMELADEDDAAEVYELLRSCGAAMAAHGYDNWNPPPIDIEGIKQSAKAGELFKLIEEGEMIATVTLLGDGVVKRLAVRPSHQSRGLGSRITSWIEQRARDAGFAQIELDALATNEGLLRFYERHGYVRLYEHERKPWRFIRMEKKL